MSKIYKNKDFIAIDKGNRVFVIEFFRKEPITMKEKIDSLLGIPSPAFPNTQKERFIADKLQSILI